MEGLHLKMVMYELFLNYWWLYCFEFMFEICFVLIFFNFFQLNIENSWITCERSLHSLLLVHCGNNSACLLWLSRAQTAVQTSGFNQSERRRPSAQHQATPLQDSDLPGSYLLESDASSLKENVPSSPEACVLRRTNYKLLLCLLKLLSDFQLFT